MIGEVALVYFVSILFFVLLVLAMAIGVMFKRKALQGSCGGLASMNIERSCNCEEVCEEHSVLYQIKEPNID